ncbi:MAG: transglutaminase domain-containing protein [Fimbriimonadaceae bacterium]
MKREVGRLTWIDFLLSGVSNGLALYAMSFGLRKPLIGALFISIMIFGTLFSVLMHRFLPSRAAWIGGVLYFGTAVACMSFNGQLNLLLPEEGFDRSLLVAGGLAWMLTCCSFFLWRESMLLFQAVPAIALFGLVGAFDTLSGAPFAFFGFLLCFATMFARSNNRTMMKQAQDAGFAARESENQLVTELKQGPWRFMAGAEWALGSALAIVLFSFLGAPIVQGAMQGVVGNIRVSTPVQSQPLSRALDAFGSSGSVTTVGNGPRGQLSNERVFRVVAGPIGYYRTTSYGNYTGRGWEQIEDFGTRDGAQRAIAQPNSEIQLSLGRESENVDLINYMIKLDKRLQRVPIVGAIKPEEVYAWDLLRPDGTVNWPESALRLEVTTYLRKANAPIENCPKPFARKFTQLPPEYSSRVKKFAVDAIRGATTDYQKAQKLSLAIGGQITYDLEADPVPIGSDAVEHTLFVSKRGYCDLFASAMVVCARSVGLPARYATGFFPVHQEVSDGQLTIRESESHAWAEIYFEGVGWVEFDPTEFAVDGRDEIGTPLVGDAIWKQTWFKVFCALLGGAGLFFAPRLVRFLKSQTADIADASRVPTAVAFKAFHRGLEKASGRPKRPSQSPTDYLMAVANTLGDHFEEAKAISGRLSYGMFAKVPLDESEVQSLREQISLLLEKLRK